MKNKKICWWMPQTGTKEERELVKQVFDNNYVNEGDFTSEFENKIAKLVDAKYAVAVTSCTAGMFLALKGLGIGSGDEVIVPDITFIATINAVDMTGANPVLVDINSHDFTINIGAIEKAITPKTKAIMPVHVTGRGADMESILSIAKKHNLVIVEDAAEALASKYKNKYLGTYGDAGCFSFSPNKTVTTGQGGVIVTNNEKLYATLRMLKDQGRPEKGSGGDDIHYIRGYNFKFTNLQAAVGLGQLNYFKARVKHMREIYQLYEKELRNVKELSIFPCDINNGAIPQWTDVIAERRDELVEYLKNRDIDSRKYWIPIHQQVPYKLPDNEFPNSTHLSRQALWLPSAFTLSDDDIRLVCDLIKKFYSR